MIKRAAAAAAIAAMLAGPPATAQTTAVTDGEITQCVVALSAASQKATDAQKASLNGVMLFFVGKLAARHSPAEIRVLINRIAAENPNMDITAVGKDCAREVEALGQTLQGK